MKLLIDALCKFFGGVLMVGLLIFLPAGTLAFPNGWLLMGILFVPMFCAGLVMMAKNPALLKSRLEAKEKRAAQDLVIKLSALMFLAGFLLAGFDFRFGWTQLPGWGVKAAAGVFLLAYLPWWLMDRKKAKCVVE